LPFGTSPESPKDWSTRTVFALTCLAWAAIAAGVAWVLVAAGWWLVANLWLTHVFVPWLVATTARLFLGLVVWAAVLCLAAILWRTYNRCRYHVRERRRLEVLPRSAEALPWSELVFERPPEGVRR